MPELQAFFSNCPLAGDERSLYGNVWRYDTIRIRYRRFEFRIVQRAEFLLKHNEHQNEPVYTTDVYVANVTPQNLKRVERLLHELSWLLSFATYSDVAYFGYKLGNIGEQRSPVGRFRHYRPTFETGNGAAIKSFVEQTWPLFSRLWRKRKLNLIIRYLLLADRNEQPTEVRLILSFVTLETLKTTYATSARIPLVKGQFRKISSPAKPNPKKEPAYTFKELLRLMLREQRMGRTALTDIIRLRNTIIHRGMSAASHQRLWASYEACHDICREYILRLLGYKGFYWPYTLRNQPREIV